MKSVSEMNDLQEWELLPDEGFLEIQDDGGNQIYSRKYPRKDSTSTTSVFQMNYFICPSKSSQFADNTLVPVPIAIDPAKISEPVKKEAENFTPQIEIGPEKTKSFDAGSIGGGDQDPVSQVFFKKMKETEFVDMKVESPKSNNSGGSRGFATHIEGPGAFHFEEEGEAEAVDPETPMRKKKKVEFEVDEGGDGVNIWKWSLSGIGAICSFGVAAATVCVIIFSTHRKKSHPKLQFQIYTNDKRMKQAVKHAKEAIAAMRGVPNPMSSSRAHITVGGYYDPPPHL